MKSKKKHEKKLKYNKFKNILNFNDIFDYFLVINMIILKITCFSMHANKLLEMLIVCLKCCIYIFSHFFHIVVMIYQRFKIKLGLELVLDLFTPILLQNKNSNFVPHS